MTTIRLKGGESDGNIASALQERRVVNLLRPESLTWRIARFIVVVAGMYGLLKWQSSKFDATEVYSIVELGVLLLAFELGVLVGTAREEVVDFVRFVTVLAGMALLLFVNAQSFDETEMWVLLGVPVIIASFEGARVWLLAHFRPIANVPTTVDLQAVGRRVSEVVDTLVDTYKSLSPRNRSIAVFMVGSLIGPLVGYSSGEILRRVPQDNKPSLSVGQGDSIVREARQEQDPARRRALLAELVAEFPELKVLAPTHAPGNGTQEHGASGIE